MLRRTVHAALTLTVFATVLITTARVAADEDAAATAPRTMPRSVQALTAEPALEPVRDQPNATVPATPTARRIVERLARIRSSITSTRYDHQTRVREREGIYIWDCPVMVAWVLERTSRIARSSLHMDRPLARDLYRAIQRAPVGRARSGWERIAHIEDVRPGDMFAWRRPNDWPPRNTGHSGFALNAPQRMPGFPRAYLVRIADATSIPHQDDTRAPYSGGGSGEGTILFMTDGHGNITHYGWHGARSQYIVETNVLFGRLHR
jgi:hypothetical protein